MANFIPMIPEISQLATAANAKHISDAVHSAVNIINDQYGNMHKTVNAVKSLQRKFRNTRRPTKKQKKTPWNMRNSARYNRKRVGTYRARSPRETKLSFQSVSYICDDTGNNTSSRVTNPTPHLLTAPSLRPMPKPGVQLGNPDYLIVPITEHLFEQPGIIEPHTCAIDISGIDFKIELENHDADDPVYVRTSILKNKKLSGGNRDGTFIDHDILVTEELFQDPYDKCKKLDFYHNLDPDLFDDDAKMKLKYNNNTVVPYHDRVVKCAHNPSTNSTVNGLAKDLHPNKKCFTIKWYPKDGYRTKVFYDGNNQKTHMDDYIYLMMYCQKAGCLQPASTGLGKSLSYKVRMKVHYKKVY